MSRGDRDPPSGIGVDIHDMEPRFGGRVVRVDVFINTDRDAEEILRKIRHVARGPRADAILMTCAVYEDGAAWAAVQEMAREAAGGGDRGGGGRGDGSAD
jgi:hypothetical protein